MMKFIQEKVIGESSTGDVRKFNKEVFKRAKEFRKLNPGIKAPSTSYNDLVQRGKDFVKKNGPRIAKLGALLTGVLNIGSDALGAFGELADEKSPARIEFDRAVDALARGDIHEANLHIVGRDGLSGVVGELKRKGCGIAAANLEKQWTAMMEESRRQQDTALTELANSDEESDDVDEEDTPAPPPPSQPGQSGWVSLFASVAQSFVAGFVGEGGTGAEAPPGAHKPE